jgi:hypothetical protein
MSEKELKRKSATEIVITVNATVIGERLRL